MTPDPFLLQLAILLMPGVIWAYIDYRFAAKPKPGQVELLIRTLVFGLASYVITYLIYLAFKWPFQLIDIEKVDEVNLLSPQVAKQIAAATVVGAVLSVLWCYACRFKLLTRFLQHIGASRSYGDEDVWDFLLNSEDRASQYVNVRDFEKKITYAGFVTVFSESEKLRELVLTDVIVYDFDGHQLFNAPRIYLSFAAEGAHIEFPYVEPPAEQADEQILP